MALRRIFLVAAASAALLVSVSTAAPAAPVFHPRVGGALGLMPPVSGPVNFPPLLRAAEKKILVTYHGGQTMTGGITVHTIFWTGGTHPFEKKPPHAPHNYIGMIKQYFSDIAASSTGHAGATCTKAFCDNLTVQPQYGWGTTPGHITRGDYQVSYKSSSDSIVDKHAYPGKSHQCTSPVHKIKTCISDAQIQREVNRVIKAAHSKRGLHQLWYVFLPPGVDECISHGVCGTNAYGGYHSVSDLGHGPVIYALSIDPIIEGPPPPQQDPEGFPDAEIAILVASHETNEATSDPEGVGYMDPNGFEIGDKCESSYGTPLGHAGPDKAPYNQVINGDKYYIQEMWANHGDGGKPGCVNATTNKSNPLPLPQIDLTQFSSKVRGNIRRDKAGVKVKVALIRADAAGHPVTVAHAATTTRKDGSWSLSLHKHAVGDDRDEITVNYSGAGAPKPSHEVILTGNGGNPFTESGWTGWFDMDHGSQVSDHPPRLTLAPCFQTGLESYSVAGKPGHESPTDFCNTTSDAAPTPLSSRVRPSQVVVWSSNDDRAFSPPSQSKTNQTGALVKLTARAGEAGSVSSFKLPLHPDLFTPGGFPICTAHLETHRVSCSGLVPNRRYKVTDDRRHASARANAKGTVAVKLAVKGGDRVKLGDGSRTLTTLHVAHLHVTVKGKKITGGSCQPGEYFGPPLSKAPRSSHAGALSGGAALKGMICPLSGNAKGLPAGKTIAQTDEFSGGETIFR